MTGYVASKTPFQTLSTRERRLVLPLVFVWPVCISLALAGEGGPGPAVATVAAVKEEELQRQDRNLGGGFPWQRAEPPKAADTGQKTGKSDGDALPDMTAGDILMRATGSFYRVAPKVTLKRGEKPENDKGMAEFLKSLDAHFKLLNERLALPKDVGRSAGPYPNLSPEMVELVEEHRAAFEAGRAKDEEIELEVLALTKDVEIEQAQTQVVLRATRITVVRNLKTAQTEMLEAVGGVELATPERKGRGERLVYRTRFGRSGQVEKDEYLLEGHRADGTPAYLWQGDDAIKAVEFFNDRHRDEFRARGPLMALVTMPAGGKAATAAPKGSVSMLGFGDMTSGTIRIEADGDMRFEGNTVQIARNVVIRQQAPGAASAVVMSANDAKLTLQRTPAGQAEAGAGVFAGSLLALECKGFVEIRTLTQVEAPDRAQAGGLPPRTAVLERRVLCDSALLNVQERTFTMKAEGEHGEVRVYMQEGPEGGKVMRTPKWLVVFTATNEMRAAAHQTMESFKGAMPTNRPATRK